MNIVTLILKEAIVDKAITSPRAEFSSKEYIVERELDGYSITNRKRPDLNMWVPSVNVRALLRETGAPREVPTKPEAPVAKRGAAA